MVSDTSLDARWNPPPIDYIWRWSGFALFFLMLFVPTTYQSLKAVLLGVTLGAIGVQAVGRGQIALHPQIVTLTLGYVALGLFFILRGLVNAAPGALQMAFVYVVWPAVYTVLIAGTASTHTLNALFRLLVWTAVAVGAYSLHYVLWALGIWPSALYLSLDLGQAIGVYGTYTEFNLYSISSLLFLVPFALAALLVTPATEEASVHRRTLWLALTLGLLATLLSGRRALLLVMAMSPVIASTFWLLRPRAVRRISRATMRRSILGALALGAALIVYLQVAHGLTFMSLLRMSARGFQFQSDAVARLRADQFEVLLAGWRDSPWFGSGHGMPAPGYIRSAEMPWAYELSYVALLYHVGLVGFVGYALGVIWIFWSGLRLIREGHPLSPLLLPVLVGTTTFSIANATNPYLEKYDFLWVLFLPVAFINAALLTSSNRTPETPR